MKLNSSYRLRTDTPSDGAAPVVADFHARDNSLPRPITTAAAAAAAIVVVFHSLESMVFDGCLIQVSQL